ncbi:MAG: glycosyltransferase [Desulfobulbus sp.]
MTNSPYLYDFDPEGDSTAARVTRAVGSEKFVLELGCAYGVMTTVLKNLYNCRVYGVEFDASSAEHARPYCEDLAIIDIDTVDWQDLLGERRFDVIMAADVLEHLKDPERCLLKLRNFLTEDGYWVISLPNVCHNGVIAELLNEDFRYRTTGLLDSTHLKFWGAKGIARALTECKYGISQIETTRMDPALSEFAETWNALPSSLTQVLQTRPDGDVYQYIVKAHPIESGQTTELDWPPAVELFHLVYENPLAAQEVAAAIAARNEAEKERDSAIAERNSAIAQKKEAEEQRNLAIAQKNYAISERDNAIALQNNALKTQNQAVEQRDIALMARDESRATYNHLLQSWSWRITRPLRFFARLIRHGLTPDDRQKILTLLKRIYHRLPIPLALRRRLSLVLRRPLKQIERSIQCGSAQNETFIAPSERPQQAQDDQPDYLFWGVIDWHFRHQRPQQLALVLAQQNRRVFYISPELIDDDRPGFCMERLDESGRIYQIRLFASSAPSIYAAAAGTETIARLRLSIGELLAWTDSTQIVSLVQHPFWFKIANVIPNSRLVYDCMDHHEGFGNNCESLLLQEQSLLGAADLTITTSSWLDEAVKPQARFRSLIRNACEFDHFATKPTQVYQDPQGRPVIGYYGAIADWFDLDLLEAVAQRHPQCSILLIGADTVHAQKRLRHFPNVTFTGEVPYQQLPFYLHGFTICLLPFKVIPLTLATNPVKAYEYLSAGKPVVTMNLPEMAQFGDLVYQATTQDQFVDTVQKLIEQPESSDLPGRRAVFASGQTWSHRGTELIAAVETTNRNPRVSVIVVTYNNLDLTKECLNSLESGSDYEPMEIIVVDNASSDDTPTFLNQWVTEKQGRKLILNQENKGFAAANNQGLLAAEGEYLVLLNNDTYVTPGWIKTLYRHLERDATIGLIGPVTNNIGNEAKIDIHYQNMSEMRTAAAAYTRRHIGQLFPLRTAAFFCVMLSRTTYELVGPLDEAFGRGFFEDDDYCRRVEQCGLSVMCAEDVFIHHHLSASFNQLRQQERQRLFEENKKIYEAKWGEWVPHNYRGHDQIDATDSTNAPPSA